MNKRFTEAYNFVKKFDEVAAEVYKDKKYYYLKDPDISKYRGLSHVEVKALFLKAKLLLKERDKAWMAGLSNRAKAALIKNRFKGYSELYSDVMNEKIDLECFEGVGHKVALEIRRWCLRHS